MKVIFEIEYDMVRPSLKDLPIRIATEYLMDIFGSVTVKRLKE